MLVAWRHLAITWTNVDLSSKVIRDNHLRAISQEVLMNLIHDMCSEITLSKLLLHLPGANELTCTTSYQSKECSIDFLHLFMFLYIT